MAQSQPGIDVTENLEPVRQQLMNHPVYPQVDGLSQLREFMRNHVFAVWDFMSLLKRLQREVANCSIPWQPPGDGEIVRFINEIVLGEESDEDGQGGHCSHFELYLSAMTEIGADKAPIETFLDQLNRGVDYREAIAVIDLPATTREFVINTLDLATTGQPHEVAAAFCYGREDVIPQMFQKLVESLTSQGHSVERLNFYLKRHIELDGDIHGPMARHLVEFFCRGKEQQFREAEKSAKTALQARIRLWDGILTSMKQQPSFDAA